MKKTISILLSVIMLISVIAASTVSVSAEESFYNATTLPIGYAISGYCNNGAKYYKITAPAKGKLNIKFNHEYKSGYHDWRIQIYKKNSDGLFDNYGDEISVQSSGAAYTFPPIGCNRNDVYYMKVRNCCSVTDLEFTISTSFNKTNYFESEFNDSFDTANNLAFNQTISANVFEGDDYFKVVAPLNGTINIKFNHEYKSDYHDWRIQVYKKNSDGLFDSYGDEISVQSNGGAYNIKISNAKKGQQYYLKVRNCCSVGELNYSLKPTIQIQKPGTPYISIKKGKATFRWAKASGVSGYQIQVSKYSNFKSLSLNKTQKSSKYIKTLSRNKKYYVRVRSYKKVGTTTYYSSWSKTSFKTK